MISSLETARSFSDLYSRYFLRESSFSCHNSAIILVMISSAEPHLIYGSHEEEN